MFSRNLGLSGAYIVLEHVLANLNKLQCECVRGQPAPDCVACNDRIENRTDVQRPTLLQNYQCLCCLVDRSAAVAQTMMVLLLTRCEVNPPPGECAI